MSTPGATTAIPAIPQHIPVNGKPIRFRPEQMIIWSGVLGVIGAAFVAGIYFLWFQVNWHVHIGSVQFTILNAKHWWDSGMGVFHSKSWVLYRHGERDLLEPAFAILGVGAALAKPKSWARKLGTLSIIGRAILLIVLAVGLAAGGVWLLNFGLPGAWHHLFGAYRITAPGWIAHSSWQILLLGFIIGRVLHAIWAPAGATLQGITTDRSVDKAKRRERGDTALLSLTGFRRPVFPLWVRYPLMAPVIRERFAWIWDHDAEVTEHPPIPRWLMTLIALVFVLIVGGGLIGHFVVGTFHVHVPYLAP